MLKRSDSEALIIEVVGTDLGLSQDQELLNSFRQHYVRFSPAMTPLDRSTFARQVANLRTLKELMWCAFVMESLSGSVSYLLIIHFSGVDMPIPTLVISSPAFLKKCSIREKER